MKTSLIRALGAATTFLTGTAALRAHPGHDGHELTWDLAHLAQHPVATLGCAAVAGVAVVVLARVVRRRTDGRDQSLRASQRSRGK